MFKYAQRLRRASFSSFFCSLDLLLISWERSFTSVICGVIVQSRKPFYVLTKIVAISVNSNTEINLHYSHNRKKKTKSFPFKTDKLWNNMPSPSTTSLTTQAPKTFPIIFHSWACQMCTKRVYFSHWTETKLQTDFYGVHIINVFKNFALMRLDVAAFTLVILPLNTISTSFVKCSLTKRSANTSLKWEEKKKTATSKRKTTTPQTTTTQPCYTALIMLWEQTPMRARYILLSLMMMLKQAGKQTSRQGHVY